MPIRFIDDPNDGGSVPRFICDYCEQPIHNLRAGIALIRYASDASADTTLNALFVHEDGPGASGANAPATGCDSRMERELGCATGYIRLDEFVDLLAKIPR